MGTDALAGSSLAAASVVAGSILLRLIVGVGSYSGPFRKLYMDQ